MYDVKKVVQPKEQLPSFRLSKSFFENVYASLHKFHCMKDCYKLMHEIQGCFYSMEALTEEK